MRQLFGSLTEQARGLHDTYATAIREKAGSLNLTQLLPMIRAAVAELAWRCLKFLSQAIDLPAELLTEHALPAR
jgi:hypothetical protein